MPVASIAPRAARIRSTARSNRGGARRVAGGVLDRESGHPGGGRCGDIRGNRGRLDRKPAFEVGVHRHVDAVRDRADVRKASSSDTALSGRPIDHANPELVVASALKPSWASARALPTSHGFGITKQPDSWS